MNFKKKGHNVQIYKPTVLINPDKFELGNNIIISEFCHIYGGTGVKIGNHVHVSTGVSVGGGGQLTIGDFCNISAGAHIINGTDSIENALVGATIPSDYRDVSRSFVTLERLSWVATNATILPGITVGEGAVVAAGSVVTEDVQPWTIIAGNPARYIKDRSKEEILRLYDIIK